MNLHAIVAAGAYFWFNAWSGNGRSLGTHIWRAERSNRPDPDPNETPLNRNWRPWWVPSHIGWRPYTHATQRLHPGGRWTTPICGRASRATTARADWAYGPDHWNRPCADCTRIAAERGIMARYYREYTASDPEMLQLEREQSEWVRLNQR